MVKIKIQKVKIKIACRNFRGIQLDFKNLFLFYDFLNLEDVELNDQSYCYFKVLATTFLVMYRRVTVTTFVYI